MPGEKRNLRSNSSTNNDRKPPPKSKVLPPKKAGTNASSKEGGADKPEINGTESNENGINGTKDIEMGDDEMTVVVPPPKGGKLNGQPEKDSEGDTSMEEQTASNEGSCIQVRFIHTLWTCCFPR